MRTRLLVVAVSLVLALAGCSGDKQADVRADPSPQTPPLSDNASKSQAALDTRIPEDQPGCSAAVGVEGDVAWQGARGVANLATVDPITPKTIFDIGSVSKQFTALAILMLQADGKLSLKDRLSDHIEGLPTWAKTVTLEQLMHHTSGIPEAIELVSQSNLDESDPVSNARLLQAIATVEKLDTKPGSTWSYSNSNYLLLGEVVHQVTGQPFPPYVRATVFEPLGLQMVVDADGKIPGKAVSYKKGVSEFEPQKLRWEIIGAGGIQTTPTELVRWADNYRTGDVGGSKVLDAQLEGAVPTSLGHTSSSEDDDDYGAGIAVWPDGTLFHNGAWGGFQTWFEVSPDRRTSLAITCNRWEIDTGELADTLRPLWF